MKTQINAYLNFNGNCTEAMNFYHKCLGGELTLQRISESAMAAQMPSEAGPKILHGTLVHENLVLMASDMRGEGLVNGNTIGLCLVCHTDEELQRYFYALAEGGSIIAPLHQTFWGATYGELVDKYGIQWLFNYSRK